MASTRDALRGGLARAERADSKSPTAEIHGHLGEASCRQPRERRCWDQWYKRALDVPHPMEPPILNLKRDEHAARPEHAQNFRKRAVLQLIRTQMMKHQNRNRR